MRGTARISGHDDRPLVVQQLAYFVPVDDGVGPDNLVDGVLQKSRLPFSYRERFSVFGSMTRIVRVPMRSYSDRGV
jgi:hypothetical protein